MEDCIFCKEYKDKARSCIGENKYFWYHIDEFPISPGHIEIIPKRHFANLNEIKNDEWNSLYQGIQEGISLIENVLDLQETYEKILKNPVNEKSRDLVKRVMQLPFFGQKPDSYNHGLNDGEFAGRTIPHLHWHVIPRYHGDVKDPRGGIRHIIPEVGNYLK